MKTFITVGKKYLQYKIDKLEEKKQTMVDYVKLKLSEEDWHGVADAAMDIREIESSLTILRGLK